MTSFREKINSRLIHLDNKKKNIDLINKLKESKKLFMVDVKRNENLMKNLSTSISHVSFIFIFLLKIFFNYNFFNKKINQKHLVNTENFQVETDNILNDLSLKADKCNQIGQELQLEKSTIELILEKKKSQFKKMKNEILPNLMKKIKDFDLILKKEMEINRKIKTENHEILQNKSEIFEELNEWLLFYKEFSNLDIKKTEDGYLLIIFKNLSKNNKEAYLKFEITNNFYEIKEIFPKIDYKLSQEILKKNKNFTHFLASIADSFITYFNNN